MHKNNAPKNDFPDKREFNSTCTIDDDAVWITWLRTQVGAKRAQVWRRKIRIAFLLPVYIKMQTLRGHTHIHELRKKKKERKRRRRRGEEEVVRRRITLEPRHRRQRSLDPRCICSAEEQSAHAEPAPSGHLSRFYGLRPASFIGGDDGGDVT